MKSLTGESLRGSQYYYTIEREIARSRSYVLYLASFGKGRLAVIKTLNEACLNSPEIINQFTHEINVLKTLTHPHIVTFYESLAVQNIPYLITEYLEGVTLEEWVKTETIDETLAIHYIAQIGDALMYLHQQGIIHQDVSPQNIIISPDGNKATLIDFSNACELGKTFHHDKGNNALETIDTGAPVTPGYAPIEQHLSVGKINECTDVYGLAATFYYLVTKTHPISALKRKGIIGKSEALIAPRNLNAKLSRRSQQAILKGLEIEPKKRIKTISKWLDFLIPPPKTRSYQGLLWFLIGIIMIASGIYLWFYFRNQPPNSLRFYLAGDQDGVNNQYTVNQGEPIEIINGNVCDPNRHTDINNIRVTLSQGTPINRFTIKDFKINADNKDCLSFDYTIDQFIEPNVYTLTAIAYDESQGTSEPYSVNLMINAPPAQLQLEKVIENSSDYEINNPLTFKGTVNDQNGAKDLAKIEFHLINTQTKKKESLASLASAELFPNEDNSNQVTFRYNIDKLAAGNYSLEAQATDKAGSQSESQSLNFKVNAAPQNLEFTIDKTSPDKIVVTGSVNDYNAEDIKRVILTLYRDDEKQRTFTLTQLTPKDSQNKTYTFELSLDSLSSGNYKLEGKAQDKSGQYSNTFTTVFDIEAPQDSLSNLSEDSGDR